MSLSLSSAGIPCLQRTFCENGLVERNTIFMEFHQTAKIGTIYSLYSSKETKGKAYLTGKG